MKLANRIDLHDALRHMETELAAQFAGGRVCTLDQAQGGRFHSIRREHAAHQIAVSSTLLFDEGNCLFQSLKTTLLIKNRKHTARLFQHHATGAEGGAEINAKAKFTGCIGGRLELRHGLPQAR